MLVSTSLKQRVVRTDDQEGSPYGTMRGDFDAIVTDQDQVEYYLPAWRAAIKGGDIRSFMCSCEPSSSGALAFQHCMALLVALLCLLKITT